MQDILFHFLKGPSGGCPTADGAACRFPYQSRSGELKYLCTRDPAEGIDGGPDSFESYCPTRLHAESGRVRPKIILYPTYYHFFFYYLCTYCTIVPNDVDSHILTPSTLHSLSSGATAVPPAVPCPAH